MEKMNIHRALAELKLLDSRINKEMRIEFTTTKKASSEKVKKGILTVEEFTNDVKSTYQSITDLIVRRNTIKSKIVKSNAETMVAISGKQMTVADAIEQKSAIELKKGLLQQLKKSYSTSEQEIVLSNNQLDRTVETMINNMVGAENKNNKDVVENAQNMAKQYYDNNKMVLVDPIGIAKTIQELEKEIDTFESEVDYVLSTSNAIVEIEV